MSEEKTPAENPHGPVRGRAIALMTPVFVVLLAAMLLVGTVLVLLQVVGLVTANGAFVVGIADALNPWAFGIGGALGIWTLLLSYAHGWKPAD